MYGQLILNSNVKTIQSGRNCLFSESCWTADNWISTYKRLNLDPYLTPYTKINSKQIKDLTERSETIKILEESIQARLWESVFLMIFFFLDFDTKSRDNKSKNKQAGLKVSAQ